MNLSYDVPSPLDYFANLVQSDANFALFEAAVSLAQDEYPELDVQSVLGEVDQLLERLHRRLPADAGNLHKLRILNHFFFFNIFALVAMSTITTIPKTAFSTRYCAREGAFPFLWGFCGWSWRRV